MFLSLGAPPELYWGLYVSYCTFGSIQTSAFAAVKLRFIVVASLSLTRGYLDLGSNYTLFTPVRLVKVLEEMIVSILSLSPKYIPNTFSAQKGLV